MRVERHFSVRPSEPLGLTSSISSSLLPWGQALTWVVSRVHGVYSTMAGHVYRLGVALHDLDDPSRVIGVADPWILEPHDPWERTGYVPNVVFTCGALLEDDSSTVRLYWGAADTVICTGTADVNELIALCQDHAQG